MQVTPFNFDQYQIRTLQHDDGEVWFVAQDVCEALEHSDTSMAVRRLDADEKGTSIVCTPSGDQQMLIISESGLYSLILTSRKPEAKRFKKWVTSEVLPSIRKTGTYSAQQQAVIESDKPDHQAFAVVQSAWVDAVERKIASKREALQFLRDASAVMIHGVDVLQRAAQHNPAAKALRAPTQPAMTVGESVPYELRSKGTKSATDLLHTFGVPVSAKELYDIMEKKNMVTTRYTPDANDSGYRVLIGDGLSYGQNVMQFESTRSTPYFYPDRFGALLKLVGALVEDAPKPTAAERALRDYKNIVKEAWKSYCCETLESASRDGIPTPYLTRSALIQYLTIELGKPEKTAQNFAAPRSDAMRALFADGFLCRHQNGWLILDGVKIDTEKEKILPPWMLNK